MGSILRPQERRDIRVAVRGSDALDRIEILRNNRVIATYCHQGRWEPPSPGHRTRFKVRIEAGWGPRLGEVPLPEQHWQGKLDLSDGRMVGWEPCWIARGQGVPRVSGPTAHFAMISHQENVTRAAQNATLFEFEARPETTVSLELNGLHVREPVAVLAERSHLLWYLDDCVQLIRDTTGVEPENARRGDCYYQLANKAKLHRIVPEAAYTATFEISDDEPLDREAHYRVRVEQRNGQRAWSSPIWVRART